MGKYLIKKSSRLLFTVMNSMSSAEIQIATPVYVKKTVDLIPLKKFAKEKLPLHWITRELILAEDSELDISVFLARLPLYFRLIDFDCRRRNK